MNLFNKVRLGLAGLMVAGGIIASASLYSAIQPLSDMVRHPEKQTEENIRNYAETSQTKMDLFIGGFYAFVLGSLGGMGMNLYEDIKIRDTRRSE